MIAYPYGSLLRYGTVLPDLDVDRFQFSPDHEQGLIVQYRFKNASTLARRLHFEWSVKTDLRPGWDPDRTGIRDGQAGQHRRLRPLPLRCRKTLHDDDFDRGGSRCGSRYGRIDQALWYMDKIAQAFNRVTPGSMSEMMPDRGCFTIAWTSYGIVLPLIEDVFGMRPRAEDKTIVLEPHLPAGWEDISIEDLPVGTNLISFSRSRIGKRVVYDIDAKENGWSFILKPGASPNARYLLNDKPVQPSPAGIACGGRRIGC